MNSKRSEEIQEQYEDALFTMLMDEYAQANGEKLLEEFQAAEARGEVPDIPEELDKKCRGMIRQRFAKRRSLERNRRIIKRIGNIAAAFFIVVGAMATVVLSVEALRTPVINFFWEQKGHFTTVGYDEQNNTQHDSVEEADDEQTALSGLLPAGYSLEKCYRKDNGVYACMYCSHSGSNVVFQINPGNGLLTYDSEDADVREIEVAGYNGILVSKDGYKLLWFVPEQEMTYQLRATALTLDEVWIIAETIAEREME